MLLDIGKIGKNSVALL